MHHKCQTQVGMANNGEIHTGATQFYITLNALPWLDGKKVVFGKVRVILQDSCSFLMTRRRWCLGRCAWVEGWHGIGAKWQKGI